MAVGEYWVYVVELDPTDLANCGPKGAVYVGETGLTPQERFAKHKAGGRTSVRIVFERGLRLRPDLAPDKAFDSRAAVLRAENRTAKKLRNRGYRVQGGQGDPFMKAAPSEGEGPS